MKRTGKIVGISITAAAILIASAVIFWVYKSPGVLPPLANESGASIPSAVNEKGREQIGGIPQGFFIRGENTENPVLLFLHGGPGSPSLPFLLAAENAERPEKYFTVCYWDQRGAGMTFNSKMNSETMTVAQMVEDTREITEYLLKRFNKNQIYLAGHSWGSYLGIKTIEKYPELYAAYVGIGQVTDQKESERLAYDFMLSHAKEIGDKKAVKDLEKFDVNTPDFPSDAYLMSVRIKYMNKYGIGMTHENASMASLVKDIFLFSGYTIAEKLKYLRGTGFSYKHVFGSVLADNLFNSSADFKIPVYIVQGAYDYQVSYELAKKYSGAINAPFKGFYTFERSAHSPNMEESARFTQVLRGIAEAHPAVKK